MQSLPPHGHQQKPQLAWVPLTQQRRRKTRALFLGGFVRFLLFRCILNTRAYFQTAHGWSAERDQAGPVCRPHPRQLPEEDPSPARWHDQASGKCGGGSAPQARPEHAGTRNSTRGTQQLREHWRSPLNWAGRLFGKPPHLWGTPLGLVLHSPISRHFSRVSKQKQKREEEKQRKGKHTFFGKRCSSHTGRLQGLCHPSLHPLSEILREDAPAFLQLFVLVPVALLHSHEPAFILRPTEHG